MRRKQAVSRYDQVKIAIIVHIGPGWVAPRFLGLHHEADLAGYVMKELAKRGRAKERE